MFNIVAKIIPKTKDFKSVKWVLNMDFEVVVKNRTATRKFKTSKVEESKIEKILNAGRLAPTAKNLQPQKIYVIKSDTALSQVDKITPCRYGAPLCILVCADKNIAWKNENYSSYESDGAIVATHMILEATNLGLGSVWVRYFDVSQVQKEFNLPENIIPICLMPIGYAADDYKESPLHNQRKELSETTLYI